MVHHSVSKGAALIHGVARGQEQVERTDQHDFDWRASLVAIGLMVCGLIFVLWSLSLVLMMLQWDSLRDFVQEYVSVRNYYAGRPIYTPLQEVLASHFHENLPIEHNAHPPVAVLMTLPLGVFDFFWAYLVWNVLSLVALGVSLWLIMRRDGVGFSGVALLPILALLVTSNVLAHQLFQGQLNLVLLLLITLCWVAWRSGRINLAGASIGLAAALKLFPAFLLLFFVIRRQWQAVISAGIVFVALNVVAGMVFGWECFYTYVVEVMPNVSNFRDTWPNASLMGLWSKLFNATRGDVEPIWQSPLAAQLALFASSAVVVALTAWRIRQAGGRRQTDVAFALCAIAMLLVSPVVWDHYFLLLILPLAILWKSVGPSMGKRALVLLAIAMLMTLQPRWIWDAVIPGDGEGATGNGKIPSIAQPIHTLTVLSMQLYMVLALFVLAYVQVKKCVTDDDSKPPPVGVAPSLQPVLSVESRKPIVIPVGEGTLPESSHQHAPPAE